MECNIRIVLDLSKASFYLKLNEHEHLTLDALEKGNLSHETINAQLQRIKGEKWETIRKIELQREPDGTYTKIPKKKE
jgi:hypothetical protein